MSEFLVPLLIFALMIGLGWALRRRPSSVQYLAALDALDDAVLVYDERGQLAHLNRIARIWFGFGEAERIESQAIQAQISPIDGFTALLSQGGHASLKIGSREVKAFARWFEEQGGSQVTLVLNDVTAHQTALAEERWREEMITLNTLSAAINASLDLDELLEIIVYYVDQATGCDRSAIFLMDNERATLSLAHSRGLSEGFIRRNQNIRPRLDGLGQVVFDRHPLVVVDIHRREAPTQVVSLLKEEGISAFAALPLRGREHVLGALTVYYDKPHAFEKTELEILRTIANQVTLGLENVWLYERTDPALSRRIYQLAAIEEVGRELTSTLDITRVFNVVLQRAMGSTGALAGLLALCDANCSELELIVEQGYPPGTLEHYRMEGWSTTDGVVGRVARTGERVLVNDVQPDPDYVPFLPTTCAQLIIPIANEKRVLGVVVLESSRSQGFSPDDVRFTTQLAELAAIAIDNARLFQQVREGRDNLQAILDSAGEGVLVVGRDERIALANPMIERMSDLSALELVGTRVGKLAQLDPRLLTLLGYPTNELEAALSLLDATSNEVTKRTYELSGTPPRNIEQVASPVIDKDGVVVGRLIVLRDVTEEHQVAEMRQNLTDMIIHDLRSPMTAVVGGVQVASDLVEASADRELIQEALDLANQSCNRLMSLVESFLDISRLEAGQMPLDRRPIMLPEVAQSVIQQMKPVAEPEMVALRMQAAPQMLPVEADRELISRVLINLIDNAIKHSPRNSTVAVEIGQEPVNEEQSFVKSDADLEDLADLPSPSVWCTVLDVGPGIPREHRKRVFERFTQLHDRRRGKGLGLAFCQLAVRAHGGRIWVDDNPGGQGSAFTFTLPVVEPKLLSPAATDQTKVELVV